MTPAHCGPIKAVSRLRQDSNRERGRRWITCPRFWIETWRLKRFTSPRRRRFAAARLVGTRRREGGRPGRGQCHADNRLDEPRDFDGTVVIGEGERDEGADALHRREGRRRRPRSISRSIPWRARPSPPRAGQNALAVIAMAQEGGFLNAPDTYMDKIAVGGGLPDERCRPGCRPEENLARVWPRPAKKVDIADLVVCILDRPRHGESDRQGLARPARASC